MRTLFTFAMLSVIAFSGVAVGQEDVNQINEIAVEAAETFEETQTSVIDLSEPAPSDAEIDNASIEVAPIGVGATTVLNQSTELGVTYPENIVSQDCGCQSNMVAPVVYQESVVEGANEVAGAVIMEGSVDAAPVADAASVVESPITDSAPVYADAGVVSEGAPMMVEGAVTGTPGCNCNQSAAPVMMATEGQVISSAPAVSYESAPTIYSSPAPTAAPCCTPARRGFFRTLFGR